jgi:chorismate synthase
MFSIPAIKAVEFGEGKDVAYMRGSEHNDPFTRLEDGRISTTTNHHGGILGGISTGEEIIVRITVKPLASIAQPQQTVDRDGNPTTIVVKGRHDPTALPRLVPIAEAMLALTLADHWLRQRGARV